MASINTKSLAIISDEAVQAALIADQGEDAKLNSWLNVPFTKKGDNSASFVTGIHVKYTKGDHKGETSYVVKVNPCRPSFGPEYPDLSPIVFNKEGHFYMELLPELNLIMTQNSQKRLPFPKCYFAQYDEGREMIIFEHLRLKGFGMLDRQKGLDLQHATLVVQCLGQLHAASIILQRNNSTDDLKSQYPFLFQEVLNDKMIENAISKSLSTGKEMLSKIGGHEKAMKWLEKQQADMVNIFQRNYILSPPFNVICHGDCWTNNFLFRYDESGSPVEAMLLDMQVNRLASLATDLNHFLFVSLEGSVRKSNVGHLLSEYYASISSIMERCGQVSPFSREDLVQEYKKKNAYGLIYGTVIVPGIVMEAEDLPDLKGIKAENIAQIYQDWKNKVMESIDKNPLCKPRFVSMYEEMLEEGLFS